MKQTRLPWVSSKSSIAGIEDEWGWMSRKSDWQEDGQWQEYVRALRDFPSTLDVLELCAGLGTGFIALALLLPVGRLRSVGTFDTDTDLSHFLAHIHGSTDKIHLGQIDGNILQWRIEDIPLAHVIVAGPPCPPWSRLGNKKSFEDPRGSVFWRVIDIVVHQAHHGHCGLFILENVEAIKHKTAGALESPSTVIMNWLTSELPSHWVVDIMTLNSLSYGIPQSRGRVFIIGRSTRLFGTADIEAPSVFRNTVSLRRFIDETDAKDIQNIATDIQQQNLIDWKQHFASQIANRDFIGSFAVFDVSRTPSQRTTWTAKGQIDAVECLTASGPKLHIISLGGGAGHCRMDRRLRGHERARLQGFPPTICDLARESTQTKKVFGNAMTVPVIGSILGSQLVALVNHSSVSDIVQWCNALSGGQGSNMVKRGHGFRKSGSGGTQLDEPVTPKRQRCDLGAQASTERPRAQTKFDVMLALLFVASSPHDSFIAQFCHCGFPKIAHPCNPRCCCCAPWGPQCTCARARSMSLMPKRGH